MQYTGRMTPAEFKEIGQRLYGKRGWQRKISQALEVEESTVSRWASGSNPISKLAERAIRSLEK